MNENIYEVQVIPGIEETEIVRSSAIQETEITVSKVIPSLEVPISDFNVVTI